MNIDSKKYSIVIASIGALILLAALVSSVSAGTTKIAEIKPDNSGKLQPIPLIDQISADFEYTDPMCVCGLAQFKDKTSSFMKVKSWYWDFGDGTTSTQQNPSHAYSSLGKYYVTLKATNSAGYTSTAKHIVRVIRCIN